jgi:hypothetical protein
MSGNSGTLGGREFYPMLPKLQTGARSEQDRAWQSDVRFIVEKAIVQKTALVRSVQLWSVNRRTMEADEATIES